MAKLADKVAIVTGCSPNIGAALALALAEEAATVACVDLNPTYATKCAEVIEQGRGGSIITLISTEGHQGYPGSVGYGTAKSGLLNFTRSVAMELAEHRIRVNSLSPTATDPAEGVDRAREWGLDWQAHSEVRGPGFPPGEIGVPLGHRPSPRHYGPAAVFLASDDAEMITGFDLRVDAGTVAKYWRWMPGY